MSRRRRRLRLVMFLLAVIVSLNYMAPLFISESAEFDIEAPQATVGPSAKYTRMGTTVFTKMSVKASVEVTPSKAVKHNPRLAKVPSSIHEESDGFNLSSRVHEQCMGSNKRPSAFTGHWKSLRLHAVFETNDKLMQLCPVWKAGTTFLRRLFLMKNNSTYMDLTNPYNISYSVRYYMKSNLIFASDKIKRFLFVRNPYDRLFSSYVDKLLAPNPYYWNSIGTRAIYLIRGPMSPKLSRRCGHDLTFSEYVKYIIAALGFRTPGAQTDPHFVPIHQLCQPCVVNYYFVGKMETFKQDYPVLVKELKLAHTEETLATLERDGDELAAIDAIEDTTHQPFDPDFQPQLDACITRREVLDRTWRKMQIRGLISPHHPLPLTQDEVLNITQNEFFNLAKEYRAKSTPNEMRAYKHRQFVEFYSQVSEVDLKRLRKYYLYDFKLFEYDDTPQSLFPNG